MKNNSHRNRASTQGPLTLSDTFKSIILRDFFSFSSGERLAAEIGWNEGRSRTVHQSVQVPKFGDDSSAED